MAAVLSVWPLPTAPYVTTLVIGCGSAAARAGGAAIPPGAGVAVPEPTTVRRGSGPLVPVGLGLGVALPGAVADGWVMPRPGSSPSVPDRGPPRSGSIATADVISAHALSTTATRAAFQNIRNPWPLGLCPSKGEQRQSLTGGRRVAKGTGGCEGLRELGPATAGLPVAGRVPQVTRFGRAK